jgi:tRNA(fMet)-specific endonuclease VapC
MHLLDTDTLTPLHYQHPKIVGRFKELVDANARVGTTIITRIEMLRGRCDFMLKATTGAELLRAQQLLAQTEAFLARIMIVPFDEVAAVQFDKLQANRKLRKIGHADLLIASIALAHRATLVTRNLRHFQQVPSLDVVNWMD